MRDPADYLTNVTGMFPNVLAQDCSGPSTFDGTELKASLIQDGLGFHQALLNAAGIMPNDDEELGSASQLLTAVQTIIRDMACNRAVPITDGESIVSGGWIFLDNYWESNKNSGYLFVPLKLPYDLVAKTIYVDVLVTAGAVRTGGDRIKVQAHYKTYLPYNISAAIAYEYDDGATTGAFQWITVSFDATTSSAGEYFLSIKAGNDGASNKDFLGGCRVRTA